MLNNFQGSYSMPYKLVLVEDETIIAMDIQQRLESLGYQVVGHAVSGEQAIHLVADKTPDLILMDVKLQGELDGIETAINIRAFSDVPIIYLTAFADEQTLSRARSTGAYGYLLKPFEDDGLRSAIEMALYKYSMESKLRESEERFSLAVRAANDGIWDWNLKTNKIYFSTRWKGMLGYKEDDITDDPDEWFTRVHQEDEKAFQSALISHIKGVSAQFECEYRIKHSNGTYLWVLSRGLVVRNAKGVPYRMAGSQSDITARKTAEERLAYDAIHDALTGLPNRLLFMDRLESHLAHAKRNPATLFAVMFIDLDRFKVVNDSLGHSVGDQLLITVAQRLKLSLRPEDTVSRLGGDEFAILLDEVKDIGDVIRVAERIKAGLVTTTFLGGVERSPTASIGIIMYNSGYTKPSELLRDADTAMYHAKALGGNRFQLFNESMHINALELIQLEGDLKKAVSRQEWLVYYQPIVSLISGETIGVEALVRWKHPQRGIVLPDKFIHIAEETGQINAIGEYVLRTSCAQARAWRDAGRPEMWVSVNLSGRQFQDQNLVETVKQILNETGLTGDGLRLEITESVAIWDIEYTVRILNDLFKLGVFASLDDFGTGYSSINHLKRFPFKSLKIDQSFIREITANKKSESLTIAIIAMARSLELEVVAEGVEKEEQLAFLKDKLCNNAQGYLLDHPMPAVDLTHVLHLDGNPPDEEPKVNNS